MTTSSWIAESLGTGSVNDAIVEADRRRIQRALNIGKPTLLTDDRLRFIANGLEIRVFELLEEEDPNELSSVASEVFQIARVLRLPQTAMETAEALVRLGCLGILGDRGADVRRLLRDTDLPKLPIDSSDWGIRVWATILDVWLRLFRNKGWEDLDAIQERISNLRSSQSNLEPQYLNIAEVQQNTIPAWELVSAYHLAKAAEITGIYLSQGSVDGHYDIKEQLEVQFDRAIGATSHGNLMSRETLTRLLAETSRTLVENSIWTVTRSVNSRITKFVESVTSRNKQDPIFEMLPPQRRTLRDEGLLGSGHRSVVVSLPTSSGKTFISEFRILQALNQFDHEKGWVAYLAPTRALVNQLTLRLRKDFSGINCIVEKVSPALEIDSLEAGILLEQDNDLQFRILVSTPEKLDLMLRSGWEQKIDRPLTLVVVDEAHGIASTVRGLRLELLLATVNRECRYAQFLLLTPFIHNSPEIARWLAPESHKSIELGVEWVPNDRVVAVACPRREDSPGDFQVEFKTQHTTRNTLEIPETLKTDARRPLGLSWSDVSRSPGKLAAATGQILAHRGTVIVLVDKPRNSWSVANSFKTDENLDSIEKAVLGHIQRYLIEEMGADFPLNSLLEYGIGVHHAGLSDDTRTIVEWLTENRKLRVLVATTTIAQGVNFPVSGVVFASHQYPYGKDMPPEDFWNIAGRAGRVDQGDLGVVALAGHNDSRVHKIEEYVGQSVSALNSTMIDMIQRAYAQGSLLNLENLSWRPEWSAFLQYLAHTYRQIGNHEQFASEVELVLRGTLGFQSLRRSHQGWADELVRGVYRYAERIKGKPLQFVDATGFSWESVSTTLRNINEAKLSSEDWTPDLFGPRRGDLQRMIGVLLQVPELREQLNDVTGGPQPNGDTLTRIISDWVQGRPLAEMAAEYFRSEPGDETEETGDAVAAMSKCCSKVFGKLTQTASWGLAALQTLTLGDEIDTLPPDEQRTLRNLPARIYYGVNSDEAVALRILGVPRTAAAPLAEELKIDALEPLNQIRKRIKVADVNTWEAALGERGRSYHHIWSIIEGEI